MFIDKVLSPTACRTHNVMDATQQFYTVYMSKLPLERGHRSRMKSALIDYEMWQRIYSRRPFSSISIVTALPL